MVYLLSAGALLLLGGLGTALISAFRSRRPWRWVLIVAPFSYPVYAARYWSEEWVRNGFLVSVLGLILAAIALYGGAKKDVSTLVDEVPPSAVREEIQRMVEKIPTAGPEGGPLPNAALVADQPAEILMSGDDSLVLGNGDLYLRIDPLSPGDDQKVPPPRGPQGDYRYRGVPLKLLSSFVGSPVRLKTREGVVREGRLVEVTGQKFFVEVPYRGGEAAFEYEASRLAQVEVYARSGGADPHPAPSPSASPRPDPGSLAPE